MPTINMELLRRLFNISSCVAAVTLIRTKKNLDEEIPKIFWNMLVNGADKRLVAKMG
jgi:hypothetical protein